MGAFQQLSTNFFKDIIKTAEDLNYSESNILILKGEKELLKAKYPQIYNNLLSCNHHRDNRTFIEYGQDLVASWLFEDKIVETLRNNSIDINLAGADRNREILSNSKVSSSSDTTITINNISIPLEIMSDYTGYWTRTKRIDLRDDKYLRMVRSKSLFLGISTKDRKFVLLDFRTPLNSSYSPYHQPYGGKPCYTIHLNLNELFDFNISNLINILNKKIK